MTPFTELNNNRLLLRKINMEDAPMILYLRSNPEVTRYIQRDPAQQTKTLEDAQAFIRYILQLMDRGASFMWAICDAQTKEMMGTICLWNFSQDLKKGEVGYDLAVDHQGNGYMNDALQLVTNYGFNWLQLDVIEAFTHRDNKASLNLLEKNGYVHQPNRKDPGNKNNLIYLKRR